MNARKLSPKKNDPAQTMYLVHPSPEYQALKPVVPFTDFTYGPVQTRRFGLSLGIQLLPNNNKTCSFNCAYCDLGPTNIKMNQIKKDLQFASPEEVEKSVRTKLRELNSSGIRVEHLTISGNGEPTLYPHLPEFIDKL